MNADVYTKAMLTIIAAALIGLVAQNAIGTVGAQQSAPQRVQICDISNRCAHLRPHTTPGTGLVSYGLQVHEFR
jgi:hypothetical protein